jgi:hypothetical protein
LKITYQPQLASDVALHLRRKSFADIQAGFATRLG